MYPQLYGIVVSLFIDFEIPEMCTTRCLFKYMKIIVKKTIFLKQHPYLHLKISDSNKNGSFCFVEKINRPIATYETH